MSMVAVINLQLTMKKKMALSGEGPMTEQLANALRANSGRVLDLFRSWDSDGDGEVSLKEFNKAVTALGLEVPKPDVDELFTSWDKDGGGTLAYKELKKILSATPSPKQKVQKAVTDVKNLGKAVGALSALGALGKGV